MAQLFNAKRGWIHLGWSIQSLIWFLVSLLIAWHLLASADFLYKTWYSWLDIDQTIARYAPANPIKPHFELTSDAERARLFAAIVDAVQNEGEGLQEIVYHDSRGNILGGLLTDAETVHLQDVANLISACTVLGMILAFIAIAWILLVKRAGWMLPSAGGLISGLGVLLLMATMLILAFGPVRVFYGLHELIFPAGHQWFFYYEESLMSLLMKAPDLFAPIAVILVALATVMTMIIWLLLHKFLQNSSV